MKGGVLYNVPKPFEVGAAYPAEKAVSGTKSNTEARGAFGGGHFLNREIKKMGRVVCVTRVLHLNKGLQDVKIARL
jgi:hypothetical protein